MPGVTGVTTALVPLLAGNNWGNDVDGRGLQEGPDTDDNSRFNEVGAGYFTALGVPLLAGREFTPSDDARRAEGRDRERGVREEVRPRARRRRQAHGSRRRQQLDIEIVGLVQDAKYSEVKDEIPPLFFRPYRQDDDVGSIDFYVRTRASTPEQMLRDHSQRSSPARSESAGRGPEDAAAAGAETTSSSTA